MICISECFPNGTITAWALKLKSVPSLDPSKLILNDPTCRPSFSDDRSAYFVFAANTCGTTRKVTKWKVLKLVRRAFDNDFLCLPCFSLWTTWWCMKMKFLCLKMKTWVKKCLERNRNMSESHSFSLALHLSLPLFGVIFISEPTCYFSSWCFLNLCSSYSGWRSPVTTTSTKPPPSASGLAGVNHTLTMQEENY